MTLYLFLSSWSVVHMLHVSPTSQFMFYLSKLSVTVIYYSRTINNQTTHKDSTIPFQERTYSASFLNMRIKNLAQFTYRHDDIAMSLLPNHLVAK